MKPGESTSTAASAHAGFVAPEANILIVDDMITSLQVTELLMSPYKTRVSVCTNGSDAVEMVSSNKYDIVFMDHIMPEMDGVEAARRIRAMGEDYYKCLPIIALTANSFPNTHELFLTNGISDLLLKPIDASKLNKLLLKWLPADKIVFSKKISGESNQSFVNKLREIPGISVDEAMAVLGGSGEVLERIVAVTAQTLPSNIECLNTHIEDDLHLYSIEVHGIKGILNCIGAFSLGKKAYTLEILSKSGDNTECKKLHKPFCNELKCLLEKITELTKPIDNTSKTRGSIKRLFVFLPEVAKAARLFDKSLATKILSPLLKFSYNPRIDEELKEISKALGSFDYIKAAELSENLVGGISLNER